MWVRDIPLATRDFKIFTHGRSLDLKRFGFITFSKQTPCTLFASCTANETSGGSFKMNELVIARCPLVLHHGAVFLIGSRLRRRTLPYSRTLSRAALLLLLRHPGASVAPPLVLQCERTPGETSEISVMVGFER